MATGASAPTSSAGTWTSTTRSSIPRWRPSPRSSSCDRPARPSRGSKRVSGTCSRPPRGGDDSQILTRLPAIVLAEVLRLHIAEAPAADRGWLAALRDPVLAPALAELHRAPERKWTVADLASAANVSRSVLDERFRQMLGRSPIRYLTDWRLHIAKELLATTDLGVSAVARRVGYDADEAFSRAFKRAYGEAPAHWRAMNVV